MDRQLNNRDADIFRKAVLNMDGDTAANILQELGSCNWSELYKNSMSSGGMGNVGLRVEFNGREAVATAFKKGDYGHYVDIAKVHDLQCKLK